MSSLVLRIRQSQGSYCGLNTGHPQVAHDFPLVPHGKYRDNEPSSNYVTVLSDHILSN